MTKYNIREKLRLSLSQSLTELLSGSGKRWITVIEAYFDESGTHRGANLLCVAGYVGDRERWSFFENEWGKYLKHFGIDYFHAKNTKCNVLKPYLVKTILDSDLKGVLVSVDPSEYEYFTTKQFRTFFGNAYSACAFGCGVEIQTWNRVLENDMGEQKKSVSIILESGQPNDSFVRRTFEAMIETPDYPIVSVTVASKKEYLPLQAADFLAHSVSTKNNKWMQELDRAKNISCAHFNKTQMESVSKEIQSLLAHKRKIKSLMKNNPGE